MEKMQENELTNFQKSAIARIVRTRMLFGCICSERTAITAVRNAS